MTCLILPSRLYSPRSLYTVQNTSQHYRFWFVDAIKYFRIAWIDSCARINIYCIRLFRSECVCVCVCVVRATGNVKLSFKEIKITRWKSNQCEAHQQIHCESHTPGQIGYEVCSDVKVTNWLDSRDRIGSNCSWFSFSTENRSTFTVCTWKITPFDCN